MTQPIRNKKINNHHQTSPKDKKKYKHPEYGTSKLEEKFAKSFLDKIGIRYDYQFKAEDIGRYYDFMIYTESGGRILVELDGDYW